MATGRSTCMRIGLALELAALRGASVAGIDASDRLVAVAQDRVPGGDVRVGDMHALPWEDHSFDVVTSFRGSGAPRLTPSRRHGGCWGRAGGWGSPSGGT